MGSRASDSVFRQGTRLHANSDGEEQHISSGDGAWIMQKCAKTLGGSCEISFQWERTEFIFQCPAEPLTIVSQISSSDFEVPPGTWGIGIDDSMIQRRLMGRILQHAGVEESKRIVLGSCPEDCAELGEAIKKILSEDDHCKILGLVDENLDFNQRDLKQLIISGSVIMKEVLSSLSPEQEARIFALIRSANDSTEDVALYMQRAHGFFPKAPMQQERVREILAPLWAERFLRIPKEDESVPIQKCRDKIEGDISKDDLLQSLAQVEKLLHGKSLDDIPWSFVWGALHSLKGDLMVVSGSGDLEMATILISSMRGDRAPREFTSKWVLIRELVIKAAEMLSSST